MICNIPSNQNHSMVLWLPSPSIGPNGRVPPIHSMRPGLLAIAIVTGIAMKNLSFPKCLLLPDHYLDSLLPDAPDLLPDTPRSSSHVNRGLCEMSWLLESTHRGIQVEDH